MKALIEELKEEHTQIIELLKAAKGYSISTVNGRTNLMKCKAILFSHLMQEDEIIYPALLDQANQYGNLKQILEALSQNMRSVTLQAMTFFKRYERVDRGVDIQREFDFFYTAQERRIRKEENIIYQLLLRSQKAMLYTNQMSDKLENIE